jgi:hypothetical protein
MIFYTVYYYVITGNLLNIRHVMMSTENTSNSNLHMILHTDIDVGCSVGKENGEFVCQIATL